VSRKTDTKAQSARSSRATVPSVKGQTIQGIKPTERAPSSSKRRGGCNVY
jgi:hypothetical protein